MEVDVKVAKDVAKNVAKNIVLGTSNPHKLEEINAILQTSQTTNIEFSLVDKDKNFDPVENGTDFEENSFIKAGEAAKIMNMYALADDTGLCVDALDGEPGLHSARYAPTAELKIEKLLNALKNVPEEKRTAKFVCVMVLVNSKGEKIHTEIGEIKGVIADKPQGEYGFGYDPIFYIPELGKTMAQMTLEEKNTLSHRARALLPMIEWIKRNL